MASRIFIALMGVWLVVSAFAWPHTDTQMINAAAVGVACVVLALAAMRYEWPRFVTAALAAWLFLATFMWPTLTRVTLWHNAVMALSIFVASLSSGGPEQVRYEREFYGKI